MASYKEYDLVVYIGRFQPFHTGHLSIVERAYKHTDNLLMLIGSSYKARSPKNPLTFNERKDIINATLSRYLNKKVKILPIVDTIYDDSSWIAQVDYQINSVKSKKNASVAIIGYKKDLSSEYLSWFKNVDLIEVEEPMMFEDRIINATDIRKDIFIYNMKAGNHPLINAAPLVESYLEPHLDNLKEWANYNDDYEDIWGKGPHLTADALVVQSGHVLLIKRKFAPGKGLWALPGGFIEKNEFVMEGMVRELHEETGLKLQPKVIRGSIKDMFLADAPDRSERSRIISMVYYVKLDDSLDLPHIRGADDAEKAEWVPISVLKRNDFREQMFEDHADLIDKFI